jgi:HSP20 family protein
MRSRHLSAWLWGDAIALLERADRLQRRFQEAHTPETWFWEPLVDILESESALVVQVALPGIPAADIAVTQEAGGITVSGVRRRPATHAVRIHRLEIPYGRFERRVRLPLHRLGPAHTELLDGCLTITFPKGKDVP